MIVSIMQPAYLPWLGYFHRILSADLHIVLDHVQLDANSKTKFANRNKVRTAQGWSWLTVPLKTKGKHDEMYIDRLETDESSRWREKHWRTLEQSYARAPHFREHAPFFREFYARPLATLMEAARAPADYLLQRFGIATPLKYSSQMGVDGRKDDLILNLCLALNAKCYLSGPFGREYLDRAKFQSAGVQIKFHDYQHPAYKQAFEGFEPYMSAVDLLFNCGAGSRQVLGAPGEGFADE